MIQFFIFGSSTAYGVGGEGGGWADLVKQKLHQKMYSEGGAGEKYELYNFGKSGATIRFVLDSYGEQVKSYRRDGKAYALVSVGGNNAKAEGEPDNYVSTQEEFREEMQNLLSELKKEFDGVIFVGSGFVDESKTNPKISPFTGGKSFFTNERRGAFNEILEDVCNKLNISLIEPGVSQDEWLEKFVAVDGLHPNTEGHKLFAEKIWQKIQLT